MMIERPFTAAAYNQFLHEKKLMGTLCQECSALHLPPRAVCPECQSSDIMWKEFSGKGHLAAFTMIHIGLTIMNAEGFNRKNPYCTGIVALEEGARVSARIIGLDNANSTVSFIGTSLEVRFIDHGEGTEAKSYLAFEAIRV